MKDKRFKMLVTLSIVCYLLAHIFPVYGMSFCEPRFCQGIWMNLLGWFSICYLSDFHIEFFIWCANPVYLITLVCMLLHKAGSTSYCPSRFTIIMCTLAAILGFQYTWSRGIVLDEGGSFHQVENLCIGYWLWELALVLLAVALWIRRGKTL